ncbi:glutathione S-transferase family protein [Roseovarius phycicola]|uniref:Glutathione S-transferase family protein n=1 Tax=Roseovarius phycicola TaxID=3080976 RepID=A0ABZ2HIA9_9RHOB
MTRLELHGYRFSVYTRIVRMVLHEKGLEYAYREVDPFAETPDPALHPFGRVPSLRHGDAVLYETAAITRYLDAAFPEPVLMPPAPLAQARMMQVISIVDSYGYWPLVRQVFSHGVFRPLEGEVADAKELEAGLEAAKPVLQALDDIASEGLVLDPRRFTLACAHLAPMLDYFTRATEGAEMMGYYPQLLTWLYVTRERACFRDTLPDLGWPKFTP